MLEKDLEILEKILTDSGYSKNYVSVILTHLVNKLSEYNFKEFTPNFLYTILSPEIGKKTSRDVSDYFEQYRSKGSYTTKLQDYLNKSPWMK